MPKHVKLTGSTKYPEHFEFIKMGGLMLDLSTTRGAVWSGVMVKPPGGRRADSLGFACSCAARSAPCCKLPPPADAMERGGGGGGRLLPEVGVESEFAETVSEAPDVGAVEGTVSAVGIPPILGVDTVAEGDVAEHTDSSSSLSNADIDKLVGMPTERPPSRRDLRSVPNEPLLRRWDCTVCPVGGSLS
jgi:hypothetical protein